MLPQERARDGPRGRLLAQRARLHVFAGVGHAPTLVQPEQRAVLREFLLAP